jgi:ABC-type multidrug transport system ATPase subunit
MTNQAVLKWEGVKPAASDEPINLLLSAGQWAVWIEDDPQKYQTFWDLALGNISPAEGQIYWFNQPKPLLNHRWEQCAFLQRLGFVTKNSRLLSGLTLLDNLSLHFVYSQGLEILKAQHLGWQWLEKAQLSDLALSLGEDIPLDKLPLALLVQALAKEPDLFFLDRPKILFDQYFSRVWSLLSEEKDTRRLAVVIFDQQIEPWLDDSQLQNLSLWTPGQFR